jgi:hypothetical protein
VRQGKTPEDIQAAIEPELIIPDDWTYMEE